MDALFLAQSYKDAWEDYQRILVKADYPKWDHIVITASNDAQAEGFKLQLDERMKTNVIPENTIYSVIPDPDGKRVGSGGATLSVLKEIADLTGDSDFHSKRILVIHSGGDSKRVPQYSALGKLFSPVPHELPDGRVSTLFDEFMIATAGIPSRMREGMLLLSGDVLLLFNPLQIDYSGTGAAAISFKEDVETGKNHGVFLNGKDSKVARFLHKQSVESLRMYGAINDNNCVDIDTGAIIFSSDMLNSLYSLIASEEESFDKYVNDKVRLSLYGDFLYPLATESTLEDFYKEKPEGDYSDELTECRTALWNVLRPYRMKLLRLAPAKFIHFGTTREIMRLMNNSIDQYSYLDWSHQVNSSISRSSISGYNSIVSAHAECGENCYFEVSYVHRRAKVGNNVLLSYVDIHDETIPDNVVLHGLKQRDGKFVVRIYGVEDNPKGSLEDDAMFLGKPFSEFLSRNTILIQDVWNTDSHYIWNADLYPECDTISDAVKAALNLYELVNGNGNIEFWKKSNRKSLKSGFNDADPEAIIAWDNRMQELVRIDRLKKLINDRKPAIQAKSVLKTKSLTKIQTQWLDEKLRDADFLESMRLHYYVGSALSGIEREKHMAACFAEIQKGIMEGNITNLSENKNCHISSNSHTVSLPLRVNWGGGWSDTPPYCNENGGTVLNAAILLDDKMPVEVTMTRLDVHKIVFDSRDMDTHGEFDDIEELQKTGDPYDNFALQKAALLACGVIPLNGGDLDDVLTRIGGGFKMQTEVTGVPKGSGLGTSSILAAATVKAIFEFLNIPHTEDDLYGHVLCMEQIMSTGGGWQDQVGGLSNGIKYITSSPGIVQNIKVQHVEISEETQIELNERFALIYTGQRRLARNLLRDVVGRYIGNEPDSLYALNEIQRMAAVMRFELERGNVDAFAELLNRHWELSKMIDSGSTNSLIDHIFNTVEDLIDGKMISGAGGGGFLQVVLKKGVSKEEVHCRLKRVFQDNAIDVWPCSLVF